jgi:hypothetical protein
MKRVIQAFMILSAGSLLFSCFKRKPPLRTWELGQIPVGSEHAEYSFSAPDRDVHENYWTYQLGVVLPIESIFDLSGEIVVSSEAGKPVSTFRFDPDTVTRSSWLRENQRISYLLSGDLGVEDGGGYSVGIRLDHPLSAPGAVVLHFLSHENHEAQINQIGEQDGARQPTTAPDSKSDGSEKPKPESEGRSQ